MPSPSSGRVTSLRAKSSGTGIPLGRCIKCHAFAIASLLLPSRPAGGAGGGTVHGRHALRLPLPQAGGGFCAKQKARRPKSPGLRRNVRLRALPLVGAGEAAVEDV